MYVRRSSGRHEKSETGGAHISSDSPSTTTVFRSSIACMRCPFGALGSAAVGALSSKGCANGMRPLAHPALGRNRVKSKPYGLPPRAVECHRGTGGQIDASPLTHRECHDSPRGRPSDEDRREQTTTSSGR